MQTIQEIIKTAYLEHKIRNSKYKLLKLITIGIIEEKEGLTRRHITWKTNIVNTKWTRLNFEKFITIGIRRIIGLREVRFWFS